MNELAGLGAAIVIRSKPTTHRRHPMDNLPKALTALAALAFALAVVSAFTGAIMGIQPEGFSRACTNLALLAIASVFISGNASTVGRS